MRRGFTLVELAIVLVIIGLLIGGILAGQSMVETSKIAATIKQLGEFDAAVANFSTRYNGQTPGDSRILGGDGDDKVEGFNAFWAGGAFNNTNTAYSCEMGTFWSQLFPGIYASSGGCGVINVMVTEISGKTNPKPALGPKNAAFIASSNVTPASGFNYYSITITQAGSYTGGYFRLQTSAGGNSTLKAIELASIDQKVDDGVATSGNVTSGTFHNLWGQPSPFIEYAGCSSAGRYLVTNPTYQCSPFFRIGGISGDLK